MDRESKIPTSEKADSSLSGFGLPRASTSTAVPPGGIRVSFPGQHGQYSGLSTSHVIPSSQVFSSGSGAFHAPRISSQILQPSHSGLLMQPPSSRSLLTDTRKTSNYVNPTLTTTPMPDEKNDNDDLANKLVLSGTTPIHSGMYSNLLFNSGFNMNLPQTAGLTNSSHTMDSKLTNNVGNLSGIQDPLISPSPALQQTMRPTLSQIGVLPDSSYPSRSDLNDQSSHESTVRDVIQRQREQAQLRLEPVIATPKPTYNRPIIAMPSTITNTIPQSGPLEPNVLTFLMQHHQLHGAVNSEQTIQQLNWINMQKKQADERQQREEEQRRQAIQLQLQREEEQRQKALQEHEELRLLAVQHAAVQQAAQLVQRSQLDYQLKSKPATSNVSAMHSQISIESDLIRRAPPYVAHSSRGRPSLRGRGGAHNVGTGRGRGISIEPQHSTAEHIRTQAAYQAEARARAEARAKQLSTHRDPNEKVEEIARVDLKPAEERSSSLDTSKIQMKELTPHQQHLLEQHQAIESSNLPIAERQKLQNALSMVSMFQSQQPVHKSPQSSQPSTPTHSHSRPNILRRSRMDNPITPLAKRNLLEAEAAKKAAMIDTLGAAPISSVAPISTAPSTPGSIVANLEDSPRKRSRKQTFEHEPEEEVRMSVNVPLTGLRIPPQGIYINGQYIQPEKKKRGRPRNDGTNEYTITKPITVTTQMKVNLNSPVETSLDDSNTIPLFEVPQKTIDGIPFYTAAEVLRQQKSRVERELAENKKRQAEEEEAFNALPVELQESIRAQKQKIMEQDAKKKEKKPRKSYTPRGLKSHLSKQAILHQQEQQQQQQQQQQQHTQFQPQLFLHPQSNSLNDVSTSMKNQSFDVGWSAQSGPLVPANMMRVVKPLYPVQHSTSKSQILSPPERVEERWTSGNIPVKTKEPILTMAARKALPEQLQNKNVEVPQSSRFFSGSPSTSNVPTLRSPPQRAIKSAASPMTELNESRVQTPRTASKSLEQIENTETGVPSRISSRSSIDNSTKQIRLYNCLEDDPSDVNDDDETDQNEMEDDDYQRNKSTRRRFKSESFVTDGFQVGPSKSEAKLNEILLEMSMNCQPDNWLVEDFWQLNNHLKDLYKQGYLEDHDEQIGDQLEIIEKEIVSGNGESYMHNEQDKDTLRKESPQAKTPHSLSAGRDSMAVEKKNLAPKVVHTELKKEAEYQKIREMMLEKRTVTDYYKTISSIWGNRIGVFNQFFERKKGSVKHDGEKLNPLRGDALKEEKKKAYRILQSMVYAKEKEAKKSRKNNESDRNQQSESIGGISKKISTNRNVESTSKPIVDTSMPSTSNSNEHAFMNRSTVCEKGDAANHSMDNKEKNSAIKEKEQKTRESGILSRIFLEKKLSSHKEDLLRSRRKLYTSCLNEGLEAERLKDWNLVLRKSKQDQSEYLENVPSHGSRLVEEKCNNRTAHSKFLLDEPGVHELMILQKKKMEVTNLARNFRIAQKQLMKLKRDNMRCLMKFQPPKIGRKKRLSLNTNYFMRNEKTFVMISHQEKLLDDLRKRLLCRARIRCQVEKFADEAAEMLTRRTENIEIDPTPCDESLAEIKEFLTEVMLSRILKSTHFNDKIKQTLTIGRRNISLPTMVSKQKNMERRSVVDREAEGTMNLMVKQLFNDHRNVTGEAETLEKHNRAKQQRFLQKINEIVKNIASNSKNITMRDESKEISEENKNRWLKMVDHLSDKRIQLNRDRIIEGYNKLVEECKKIKEEVQMQSTSDEKLNSLNIKKAEKGYVDTYDMCPMETVTSSEGGDKEESAINYGSSNVIEEISGNEVQQLQINMDEADITKHLPTLRTINVHDEITHFSDLAETDFIQMRKNVMAESDDNQCLLYHDNNLYEKVIVNGSIHYLKLRKTTLQESIDEKADYEKCRIIIKEIREGLQGRKLISDYLRCNRNPLLRKMKLELANDGEFAGKLFTDPFTSDKMFHGFFPIVNDDEITVLEVEELKDEAIKLFEKYITGTTLTDEDISTLHECLVSLTKDMVQRHTAEIRRREMKLKRKMSPQEFETACRKRIYKVWDKILEREISLPKIGSSVGDTYYDKMYESIRSKLIEKAKMGQEVTEVTHINQEETTKGQNSTTISLPPCEKGECDVQSVPLCLSRNGMKKWYVKQIVLRERGKKSVIQKILLERRLSQINSLNQMELEAVKNRIKKFKKKVEKTSDVARALRSAFFNVTSSSVPRSQLKEQVFKKAALKLQKLERLKLKTKLEFQEKVNLQQQNQKMEAEEKNLEECLKQNEQLKRRVSFLDEEVKECKEAIEAVFKTRKDESPLKIFEAAEEIKNNAENSYKKKDECRSKDCITLQSLGQNTEPILKHATSILLRHQNDGKENDNEEMSSINSKISIRRKVEKLLYHFEKQPSDFIERTSEVEYLYLREREERIKRKQSKFRFPDTCIDSEEAKILRMKEKIQRSKSGRDCGQYPRRTSTENKRFRVPLISQKKGIQMMLNNGTYSKKSAEIFTTLIDQKERRVRNLIRKNKLKTVQKRCYLKQVLIAYVDKLDQKIGQFLEFEITSYRLMENILQMFDPKGYLKLSQEIRTSFDPHKTKAENRDEKMKVLRRWITNLNVVAPHPAPAFEQFPLVINNPSKEVVNQNLRAKSPFWNGPPCMENENGIGISRKGQMVQSTPIQVDIDGCNESKGPLSPTIMHPDFIDIEKPSWKQAKIDEIYDFVREFDQTKWKMEIDKYTEKFQKSVSNSITNRRSYFIDNEPQHRNRRDIVFKNKDGVIYENRVGLELDDISLCKLKYLDQTYEKIRSLGEIPREMLSIAFLNNHKALMSVLKIKLSLLTLIKKEGIFGRVRDQTSSLEENIIVPSLSTKSVSRIRKGYPTRKRHQITPEMYAEFEKKKFFASDYIDETSSDISKKQPLCVSISDEKKESKSAFCMISMNSPVSLKSPSSQFCSSIKSPTYITSPVKSPSPMKSPLSSPVASPLNLQFKNSFHSNLYTSRKENTPKIKVRRLLSDNEDEDHDEDEKNRSEDGNLTHCLVDVADVAHDSTKDAMKKCKKVKRNEETETPRTTNSKKVSSNHQRVNKNRRSQDKSEEIREVEIKSEPIESGYEDSIDETQAVKSKKKIVSLSATKRKAVIPSSVPKKKKSTPLVAKPGGKELKEIKQEMVDESYEKQSKRHSKRQNSSQERSLSPISKRRSPVQSRRSHPTADMRYDRVLEYVLQKSLEEAQQAQKQIKK